MTTGAGKIIFWNVDTQYDFMRDDESHKGLLPVPGARAIERNLKALTRLARAYGIGIVSTADWHTMQSREFSDSPDYKTTFPPHCLQGTKGASYVPATAPKNPLIIDWQKPLGALEEAALAAGASGGAMEIVLYKDAFDVFAGSPSSPHADRVLEILRPESAIVYGVATNVCVNFAVLGLLDRGIEVYVVGDAIKELPGLSLDETMRSWQAAGTRKGAHLISAHDVGSLLKGEYTP